jgi:hypothetical protein
MGRLGGGALVAGTVWVVLGAAAASGATVPNPCTLVSASAVASSLGLEGAPLTGVLSKRADGPVKQSLCTYTHGTTKIQVQVAPHIPSGGSGGGVPGMKETTPAGLGSTAHEFYDTNPKFAFTNVQFTKGSFDAGVYDSGTIPNARIVALAKILYKSLP